MSGHFDYRTDVQITVAIALHVFHPFSFEAEQRAILSAGWNFYLSLVTERRHFDVCAQSGLHKTDRHFAKEIVSIALEDFVRLDVDNHVKIAGGSAAHAAFT